MHCRSSWGNRCAWASVVAFGILGAATAKGASPNTRSRSADPSIAHPTPLIPRQKDDTSDPSQCTNYDYPGKATPAEVHTVSGARKHLRSLKSTQICSKSVTWYVQIGGSSHRALLTATGAPSHKLSSVLQHMIPRKSFLEVRSPQKAV